VLEENTDEFLCKQGKGTSFLTMTNILDVIKKKKNISYSIKINKQKLCMKLRKTKYHDKLEENSFDFTKQKSISF